MAHDRIVFYVVHKDGQYLKGLTWYPEPDDATCYTMLGNAKVVAALYGAEVLRYYATSVPWREV